MVDHYIHRDRLETDTISRGDMNEIITFINKKLIKLISKYVTARYEAAAPESKIAFIPQFKKLVNLQLFFNKLNVSDGSAMIYTRFKDIKDLHNSVVLVSTHLQTNRDISKQVGSVGRYNKEITTFMMSADSVYVDPTFYVTDILKRLDIITDYPKVVEDKSDRTYIHNTYLLQYYVEDLVDFIKALIRTAVQ